MNSEEHNLHFATREVLLAECLRLRRMLKVSLLEPEQEEWEKAYEKATFKIEPPYENLDLVKQVFKEGWQARERKQGGKE